VGEGREQPCAEVSVVVTEVIRVVHEVVMVHVMNMLEVQLQSYCTHLVAAHLVLKRHDKDTTRRQLHLRQPNSICAMIRQLKQAMKHIVIRDLLKHQHELIPSVNADMWLVNEDAGSDRSDAKKLITEAAKKEDCATEISQCLWHRNIRCKGSNAYRKESANAPLQKYGQYMIENVRELFHNRFAGCALSSSPINWTCGAVGISGTCLLEYGAECHRLLIRQWMQVPALVIKPMTGIV